MGTCCCKCFLKQLHFFENVLKGDFKGKVKFPKFRIYQDLIRHRVKLNQTHVKLHQKFMLPPRCKATQNNCVLKPLNTSLEAPWVSTHHFVQRRLRQLVAWWC